MKNQFDVIVVGGGHAGIEAASAAARMGSQTLLLTPALEKIASMPCNPSIGGLGKGHIVYEVSALGGLMPKLATKTYLQARMLNTRKGPAVQGLRLQIDKYEYCKEAKKVLLETPNLTIKLAMVESLLTQNEDNKKQVSGVKCSCQNIFYASCVIITTGTFMSGVVHIGHTRYKAGRRGEEASYGLSESIAKAMNISIKRLKTGTPPRLLRSSLDFSSIKVQDTQILNYLYEFDPINVKDRIPCYITQTNAETCSYIKKHLHLSALFSGNIKGIGPRYCPSIEDKVDRFPGHNSHHVFVEPEGAEEGYDEIYPAGLSTSLPFDIQQMYIRSISGFEKAIITKCGYAIEYDFIQPNNLTQTLETKQVEGLFLAGQVIGTTGYEEAAGQGIIAGINAYLKHTKQKPFILNRNESYIGVMIDDIVTLGVNEPYRMFTSRAERRLLLRQDNVFLRLMPYGKMLGLIEDELYKRFLHEKEVISMGVNFVRGQGKQSNIFQLLNAVEFSDEVRSSARTALEIFFENKGIGKKQISSRALLCIHAEIKYDGYIKKENFEVEKAKMYQGLELPSSMEYSKISGLTKEIQEKLSTHKPKSIAQAQLIPGMTPAAISILIFQSKRTSL
jgi:tRNA uridine 5-carboxymethylaminomethyl modification enzyme